MIETLISLFISKPVAPIVVQPPAQTYKEERALDAWAGYPELKRICSCESNGKPNGEPTHFINGKVLRGHVDNDDIGQCQVNQRYHIVDANKMGLDIYTPAGNVAYAKHLYKTQGKKPWSASKGCWG